MKQFYSIRFSQNPGTNWWNKCTKKHNSVSAVKHRPFEIYSDIPHTQKAATSQMTSNKSQIPRFHNIPNTRAWNLRTNASYTKVNQR